MTERIYAVLLENSYQNLIGDMINDYGIGGTPGEMFSIVCVWLAKMRNSKNEAYNLIRDDADTLLNYAIEIKYFRKKDLDRR